MSEHAQNAPLGVSRFVNVLTSYTAGGGTLEVFATGSGYFPTLTPFRIAAYDPATGYPIGYLTVTAIVDSTHFTVTAEGTAVNIPAGSVVSHELTYAGLLALISDAISTASSSYVPTTRTISTTAPLTGGGDLSANRTLAISDFTGDSGSGGAKGAVPAPAAGDAAAGKFLKASGGWDVPGGGSGGMTLIQTITAGGGGAATLDFTSIPGTYNHLVLLFNGKGDTGGGEVSVFLRFNNDTGSNYDGQWIQGQGSSPLSGAVSANGDGVFIGNITDGGGLSGRAGAIRVEIVDYANTNWGKIALSRYGYHNNGGFSNLRTGETYGNWNSTSAINRVTVRPASGNFQAGTKASLYGMA